MSTEESSYSAPMPSRLVVGPTQEESRLARAVRRVPVGFVELTRDEVRFRTVPPSLPGEVVDLEFRGSDGSTYTCRLHVEAWGENDYSLARRLEGLTSPPGLRGAL